MLLSSMMSSWFSLVKPQKLHARSREKAGYEWNENKNTGNQGDFGAQSP